jgi:L-alanine-DL-glutamate epimerase-like enolase superfamily enzyme
MKIIQVDTVHVLPTHLVHWGRIGWTWVRLHTDAGIVGIGETHPVSESEIAIIHKSFAPRLLGSDPLEIERLWREMFLTVQYHGWAGAEMRAISAIDIALWDIFGKAANLPVYQLLGGKFRERIRTYNTCYDDECDFNTDADKLAISLREMGIRAMKIWPFDQIAIENQGNYITAEQMNRGLEPLRKIREAVGDEMEIMMEFHGYWNIPTAIQLAHALEPFNVVWLEELIAQDNLDAYRVIRQQVKQPLTVSERLFGKWAYADLLKKDVASYVMLDPAWTGGLTEARKIAALADSHYLPIALHSCSGPVVHAANLHLAASIPNLYILESVRRHYQKEFKEVSTMISSPDRDGCFPLLTGPGLGVELKPEFLERANVVSSK